VTWRAATNDFGGEEERRELLRLLASVERLSEHPLGSAVVRHAREAGIATSSATQFAALTGRGVEGVVSGVTVIAGTDALLREHDVDPSPLEAEAARLSAEAKTVIYVAAGSSVLEPLGLVAIADPIRPDSAAAVRALSRLRLDVVLLTGDNRPTALAIAREAGIDEVVAEVLPDGKLAEVRRLQDEGHV